jgi:hypothetical protein
VKVRKNPVKIIFFIAAAVLWAAVFIAAKKHALLLPWALIQAGLVYQIFWLFLEKTTISVFPEYIMVVHNYFFMDITGKFFQRDAVTGVRKTGDNAGIVFEYLGRPQTLVSGLSPDEASYVMKFLVFSLGKEEFKRI